MRIAYIRSTGIYYESRPTTEIKTLLKAGYDVTVFGWDRDGTAREKCNHVFGTPPNLKLYFFKMQLSTDYIGGGIKGTFQILKWKKWVKKQLAKFTLFDYVYANDLDGGIGVYEYCKKNNIKLIYKIKDYYIDSHRIPKLIKGYVEHLEIKMINLSNTTIICTEERREQIKKASPKNIVVIYNTPDLSDYDFSKIICEYDYVYCGVLSKKRMIDQIFEEYENNSDLKVCFAGCGELESEAIELNKKFKNFTFLGKLPYNEVLNLESKSLCLSAIYNSANGRNHRLCAPNKFYESLALAKPVIVCKGTGIDKVVKENNLGMVIDYDVNQFYQAIRKFKNNPLDCEKIMLNNKKQYDEKYSWKKMEIKFLNIFK